MTFDAWIQRRDGLVLQGKSRNIGVDGMFVELSECPLIRNTIVEVAYGQAGQPSMPQRAPRISGVDWRTAEARTAVVFIGSMA